MSLLDKLAELFMKFPGIGSRQARRFAYFVLQANQSYIDELIATIQNIRMHVRQCSWCFRYFEHTNGGKDVCTVCAHPQTNQQILMVVEKDIDADRIHASGTYHGCYFILGTLFPLAGKRQTFKPRVRELLHETKRRAQEVKLREIIIALSATPEGDYTAAEIKKLLSPSVKKYNISITTLGRGVSTGTELEYIDEDTMQNALQNRRQA